MQQSDSSSIRILVIDDNEAIHDDFRLVFTTPADGEKHLAEAEAILFGKTEEISVKTYEIDSAFQGETGIEKIRQASEAGQPYAVAFVDVRMPPGIDGVQTTKGIWEVDPHVQVVLCSAYSDYSWTDLIKELGETDRLLVMQKPFESIEARQMASALSEKWRLVHQMEQKVQERTKKLERINEELEEFSYVVAHDLTTPLRGMHTLIDWIIEDCGGSLDAEAQTSFALLKNRAQRMENLINSILDYCRAGHCSEKNKPVDFNEIVSQVIEMIHPPENIDITISTQLPTVIMGETHALRLFQNLLSNAVRYMDKPHGVIRLDCERLDGFWKLSIADNGPGIEKRYFEKIFTLSQSLAAPNKDESTGIGLAIVKQLVNQYDGQVGVESEIGRGTTFWFTIADNCPGEENPDIEAYLGLRG